MKNISRGYIEIINFTYIVLMILNILRIYKIWLHLLAVQYVPSFWKAKMAFEFQGYGRLFN